MQHDALSAENQVVPAPAETNAGFFEKPDHIFLEPHDRIDYYDLLCMQIKYILPY